MRKRLYEIIEQAKDGDRLSAAYDSASMLIIIISLIPLTQKGISPVLQVIDLTTAALFVVDYILRLMTADFKIKKGSASFLLYPITPMALIDLLCILPSFTALSGGWRVLKVFRLFRTVRAFRVVRALKMARYSRSLKIIADVIQAQKTPLLAVCTMAIAYILLAALVIFNVEPETFSTFFDAIYWAAVSLTTMGYGDIYPVTTAGRIVTILSSFVGIAIVALPSGIITAGYMDAINDQNKE